MSRRFINWSAAIAISALALAGTATAARAGQPTPSVTTTAPVGVPSPASCARVPRFIGPSWNWNWGQHRDRRCAQQEFDIQFGSLLPADAAGDGAVLATGPISFRGGFDVVLRDTPTTDFLETDATGVNHLTVRHLALFGSQIDRVTCTIMIQQTNLPWSIVPGSGAGRFLGAFGNGFYSLNLLASYPTFRNVCTLPRFLSPGFADWSLNHGGRGLPTPLAESVDAQAVGLAAVPKPVPCPTVSYAWINGNGPTDCPTPYSSPTNS